MGLEDLPQPIKDHIMSYVNKDKDYENNRISVTELTRCTRKSYYVRKFGDRIDLKQAYYLFRGIVWDEELTCRFESNQRRVTHRIMGTPILISGRYDFVWDGAVWDLKTTDGLYYISRDGMKDEHAEQVKFYAVMEGLDKGALVYMSFGDAEIFKFEITPEEATEIVDRFEKKAIDLYTSLTNNSPPERGDQYKKDFWECRYCTYRSECYGE